MGQRARVFEISGSYRCLIEALAVGLKEFRDRDSIYTTNLDAAIEATGLLLKLAMSGSVPLL